MYNIRRNTREYLNESTNGKEVIKLRSVKESYQTHGVVTFEGICVVELSLAVETVISILIFVSQLMRVQRSFRWKCFPADVTFHTLICMHCMLV